MKIVEESGIPGNGHPTSRRKFHTLEGCQTRIILSQFMYLINKKLINMRKYHIEM